QGGFRRRALNPGADECLRLKLVEVRARRCPRANLLRDVLHRYIRGTDLVFVIRCRRFWNEDTKKISLHVAKLFSLVCSFDLLGCDLLSLPLKLASKRLL